MEKPILVIDSNVIIKHQDLNNLQLKYDVYTVPSVISEIRDPVARTRLRELAFELKSVMPEKDSITQILEFSKKTGDYVSISPTDGQVISLAYQCLQKKGKGGLLRKEPRGAKECISGKVYEYGCGEIDAPKKEKRGPVMMDSDEEEDPDVVDALIRNALKETDPNPKDQTQTDPQPETKPDPQPETKSDVQPETKPDVQPEAKPDVLPDLPEDSSEKNVEDDQIAKPYNPNIWVEGKDWDTDDEDGWVNPENFNQLVLGKEVVEKEKEMEDMGVFIMTSDYAMQNIILQIGIPLLAIDGYMIKRVKSYILECFTCWKLCRDLTKQFCPSCKYATLLRVTCSYNMEGDLILYRRKNWQMNRRGQVYDIPTPKGGRKNNDLILNEEQLTYGPNKLRINKAQKFRDKEFYEAQKGMEMGCGFEDTKKTNKHFKNYQVGYGRNNPNDNAFQKKKSNKK